MKKSNETQETIKEINARVNTITVTALALGFTVGLGVGLIICSLPTSG